MRRLAQILCALLLALPYGLRPACARASQRMLQTSPRSCCALACCCNSRPGLSRCQTLPGRDGSEADAGRALPTDSVRPAASLAPSIAPHAALDWPTPDAGPIRFAVSDPRGLKPDRSLERLCTLQV